MKDDLGSDVGSANFIGLDDEVFRKFHRRTERELGSLQTTLERVAGLGNDHLKIDKCLFEIVTIFVQFPKALLLI